MKRPCEGRNANVCVAEGCYGEACLSVTTWEVHVTGPDDILAATSRLDAMVQAQQINADALHLIGLNNDDPMYPTVWATPRRAS